MKQGFYSGLLLMLVILCLVQCLLGLAYLGKQHRLRQAQQSGYTGTSPPPNQIVSNTWTEVPGREPGWFYCQTCDISVRTGMCLQRVSIIHVALRANHCDIRQHLHGKYVYKCVTVLDGWYIHIQAKYVPPGTNSQHPIMRAVLFPDG